MDLCRTRRRCLESSTACCIGCHQTRRQTAQMAVLTHLRTRDMGCARGGRTGVGHFHDAGDTLECRDRWAMAFSAVGRDAAVAELGTTEIGCGHWRGDHAGANVTRLAAQIAQRHMVGRGRYDGAAGGAEQRRIVTAVALRAIGRGGRNIGVDIGYRGMLAPGAMARGATGRRAERYVVSRWRWRSKISKPSVALRTVSGTGVTGVIEGIARTTRDRSRIEAGVLGIGRQCAGRTRVQLHPQPAQAGFVAARAIATDALVDHR